jgi:asparagine synthetase B (glutamine-hydrolysing)
LEFGSWDMLSKAQYLEMSVFLSGYLLSSQGDRPAMAHSLEIRLPFLDYRVIDFAFRLPARWKIKGLKEKYILKQASEGLVTDGVKERPKQPYRAPIREVFFGGEEAGLCGSLSVRGECEKGGVFQPEEGELCWFRNTGNRRRGFRASFRTWRWWESSPPRSCTTSSSQTSPAAMWPHWSPTKS